MGRAPSRRFSLLFSSSIRPPRNGYFIVPFFNDSCMAISWISREFRQDHLVASPLSPFSFSSPASEGTYAPVKFPTDSVIHSAAPNLVIVLLSKLDCSKHCYFRRPAHFSPLSLPSFRRRQGSRFVLESLVEFSGLLGFPLPPIHPAENVSFIRFVWSWTLHSLLTSAVVMVPSVPFPVRVR